MADYLTLLARRSLGMVQPMRPTRAHRYTDVLSLRDGTIEESAMGRGSATPVEMTELDRAVSDANTPPVRESHPVAPSPSGAFPEVDTASFMRPPDRPADDRLNDPELSVVERRGQGTDPRKSVVKADMGETDGPALLVPNHSGGEETKRIHGSSSETVSPVARVGVEGNDAVGSPPSTDDSAERGHRRSEWPAGDSEADSPSDNRAVEVAIGTIEVRAITPSPPAVLPRPQRVSPKLGLDDYLAQRRRGER